MDGVLDKGSIIQLLNSHREEVSEFGVERIGLFGSYYNNKAHPKSVLVEIQKGKKPLRTS